MSNNVWIALANFNAGGAQGVAIDWANWGCLNNQNVVLVSFCTDGFFKTKVLANTSFRAYTGKGSVLSKCFWVLKNIVKDRPRVVFCSQYQIVVIFWLVRLVCRLDYKIVSRVTNNKLSAVHSSRPMLEQFLRIMCFKFSDALQAPSKQMCNNELKQTFFIPSPVDVTTLMIESESKLETINGLGGQPFFVIVGSLTTQKRCLETAKVFANAEGLSHLKLIFVGDGPLGPDLARLVRELSVGHRIMMLGNISNVAAIIKRATGLILNSQWEGMPNVLLQSMALGTPIIAADCDYGPRELYENVSRKDLFRLIPNNCSKALELAMIDLASQNVERECFLPQANFLEESSAKFFKVLQEISNA